MESDAIQRAVNGVMFTRAMQDLLRPHKQYADAYVDDAAIMSMSFLEHMGHLDKVLGAFEEVSMMLKLRKASFCKPAIKFLGHVVGSSRKSIAEDRVVAIHALPEPSTKRQLCGYLGLANFFRQFIPSFAQIAFPLTEMTKKDAPAVVKFNDQQRAAFLAIKNALCEATSPYVPSNTKPFILRTDASDIAIGGCLAQLDDKGVEHPAAFMSIKLTPAQRRYSTIEREALAIVLCLARWDWMLFASHIDLYCDHNPLSYVVTGAVNSSKLTRWALAISRYDIDISFNYIAGPLNVVSDYLTHSETLT